MWVGIAAVAGYQVFLEYQATSPFWFSSEYFVYVLSVGADVMLLAIIRAVLRRANRAGNSGPFIMCALAAVPLAVLRVPELLHRAFPVTGRLTEMGEPFRFDARFYPFAVAQSFVAVNAFHIAISTFLLAVVAALAVNAAAWALLRRGLERLHEAFPSRAAIISAGVVLVSTRYWGSFGEFAKHLFGAGK